MSKSLVKKALEMLDDGDNDSRETKTKSTSIKKKKKKIASLDKPKSTFQDRKELIRTCLTLKKMSKPVVSTDQIEQLNNYRFGGPSKRDLEKKKKKEKTEEIFTEEDFKRFEKEYNPPLQKS